MILFDTNQSLQIGIFYYNLKIINFWFNYTIKHKKNPEAKTSGLV